MSHVELPHGTVHYSESGAGAPVLFLHGYLMGAGLWAPVVRLLEEEFRCLVPELPFGAHPAAMRPGADLTAAGLGRLVADFLDALELTGVTLVGNDSGAAVAQVVSARHAGRLGGLVLATGDAFDNFPPRPFRPLITAARTGTLTPALADDEFMTQIAAELAAFTKPALLAWAADDKFFPVEHARRLAAILPGAQLDVIAGSRTWVMRDQPERTAELIAELARRTAAARHAA